MKTFLTGAAAAALCLGAALPAGAEEWNVSLWGKARAFTSHVEKLAEVLDETTDGEFTLNISYGGLSKNTENLDGISIGAFEMAQFCAGYHRDKNPSITVLELPFLGVNTLEEEIAVSMAVYNHPAVQDDLGRWNAKLLMPSPLPQYNLVGTGEPRTTLEDFDGMRVRATGGIGEAFRTVGAVPTSVTSSEAYAALDSGTVDTVAFAPHAHLSFRTIDMADWWTTNLNPGTVNCPVVVNTDAYEMLSDEHREALDAAIPVVMDHYLEAYGKIYEQWDQVLEERGVEKVTFSEEDLAAFRAKAADPIREKWIADMSAQGLPAQELYDVMMDALAKAQM
ncbi:TRAP-type C4-dicarboxylate transport system, substrate-binding protein [Pseudooceanicola antarcticus]|uniref:C4-dicarboxylate ABC transporter substrate-binding protein n=1 Tax=Pseudooceanicola antarcticus TaxID=1247613 RepID=A0A285JEU9_9RHOB|nr:C4-dicarboxylate TRAP transporter substrate-binding protein [Pseudooceanicola antarcticus]PJE31051.1 C4-dicarboxylate ABC transporter substrate-binding protein [Pseudooceanicola antarcticus]SNY58804.1 TRAP-type C4-dicarboxylate transport system, substrate-binding protein [Pseudooceanicola antarcticus]